MASETTDIRREPVGFIGLGRMGRGMARNLLRGGVPLTVWNRTAERAEPLQAAGAVVAGSAAELARRCRVVLVCVSDTPDVEEVVEGPQGILAGAVAGTLVVDCSTIRPATARRLATSLAAHGCAMLDAPVSGGSEGAEQGTLSIMVGGEPHALERARPYLALMGRNIVHVGGSGAGQLVKLVNQVLVVGHALAMSEALLLAERSGVELEPTLAAVTAGAGGSWMLTHRGPQILQRDWRPGFTIDLQQKDLRLVLETAAELGVSLPGTAMIQRLYATLQARGLGSDGNHALFRALEHLEALEPARRPHPPTPRSTP
jgi:3-hydroxyisobutyrate dehydrogenase